MCVDRSVYIVYSAHSMRWIAFCAFLLDYMFYKKGGLNGCRRGKPSLDARLVILKIIVRTRFLVHLCCAAWGWHGASWWIMCMKFIDLCSIQDNIDVFCGTNVLILIVFLVRHGRMDFRGHYIDEPSLPKTAQTDHKNGHWAHKPQSVCLFVTSTHREWIVCEREIRPVCRIHSIHIRLTSHDTQIAVYTKVKRHRAAGRWSL